MELRLIVSCSWIRVAAVSSPGGWIQVRLSGVPATGYKLRLNPSYGWLEFRRLDTSCSWLYPMADSSSSDWVPVTADSIPRLTRVLAARHDLQLIHPAADYELWLIRFCDWLEYFNISSKFKDLFCKIHHFYGLFFTAWFQLPLMQALAAASRTLKKLEEVWGSLKKLEEASRI